LFVESTSRLSWRRVTEIPEHLLKRSRDRRAALGLGGGDEASTPPSGGDAPAAAAPATSGAAAPAAPAGPAPRKAAAAPAPPPPPKPDPPYVAAAKSRKKIPFWAMLSLSLLPVWLFMYVRSVTEAPEVAEGPIGIGAEEYGACASCHGSSGEGGAGRPLADGEVLLTFPHIEDQLRFVTFGTEGYNLAGVSSYGNPDREGGPHLAGDFGVMPAQDNELTDDEILAVVCHERYTLGGADPGSEEYAEEYENWCSDESPIYAALESGTTSFATLADAGITGADGEPIEMIPIGDAPAEGSPPG
jgi:mono/diheme cytochrome c family protein